MDFSGRISKTPIRPCSISLYIYTLYFISFIAPFSNGRAIFPVNLPTVPLLFRRKRALELCLFPRSKIKYCRILLREFPFFRLQFADICLSLSNLFSNHAGCHLLQFSFFLHKPNVIGCGSTQFVFHIFTKIHSGMNTPTAVPVLWTVVRILCTILSING